MSAEQWGNDELLHETEAQEGEETISNGTSSTKNVIRSP
jgi:hypothetical protein